MVILICGATHCGKTLAAQKLSERTSFPYISLDHLKMGLIRSGYTDLSPDDDFELTRYLWPITREMIKTVIENKQNLIIEGCYIPFNWKDDFSIEYLTHIRFTCLVMSHRYIETHFSDIICFANVIENRLDDSYCTKEQLIADNEFYLNGCKINGCNYQLIDEDYDVEIHIDE